MYYVHVHVVAKSLITSTWVRHGDPLSWPLGKNTGTPPSVHKYRQQGVLICVPFSLFLLYLEILCTFTPERRNHGY